MMANFLSSISAFLTWCCEARVVSPGVVRLVLSDPLLFCYFCLFRSADIVLRIWIVYTSFKLALLSKLPLHDNETYDTSKTRRCGYNKIRNKHHRRLNTKQWSFA